MDDKNLDLTFGDDQAQNNANAQQNNNKDQNTIIVPEKKAGKYATNENDIENIQISAVKGPVIVFFGPREIGKTVTLMRLSQYVSIDFDIEPNPFFRKDSNYKQAVAQFKEVKNSGIFAPDANGNINYMLLDVKNRNRGNVIAQLLEAPGEHYFDPEETQKQFPGYLNKIFNDNYKKIYVFFFELGMLKPEDRGHYSAKINTMLKRMRADDRAIVVLNKADMQEFRDRKGKINVKEYKKTLANDFGPILQELDRRKAAFVPFSAGIFGIDGQGRKTYTPSPDEYPRMLWNTIFKKLRGRF